MKKLLLQLLCVCGFSYWATAQAPQSIPYQAVARDAAGNLLISKPVCVQFRIYNQASGGTLLYEEHNTVTTNTLGLFTLNVGQGIYDGGLYTTLSNVNWGSTTAYIEVGLDLNNTCSGYVTMGRTQMMSVPYALYAGNAASGGTPQVNSDWNAVSGVAEILNKPALVTLSSLSATTPITYNNSSGAIGIGQATTSTNGYVSSTDWNTFNNKQATLSFTSPLSESGINVSVGYDNSTIKVLGGNLYAVNTGTVTNIGTTGPITGGTITGTGTIGCATCLTTGTISALGNPTAKVELTAATGSGTTAMYANSTLAIDQSITPTWTGTHTFSSTSTYSALFTGGNVGIGTTTPAYKLQVVDNVTNGTTAEISSSTNNAELLLNNTQTGGHTWYLGSTGGSAYVPSVFRIYNETTGSTDLVTITGAGNVGIATNSPGEVLDVVGNPTFGASTERLSMGSGSLAFNRRVATGAIYNSSAYAYQFQHATSTTQGSDYLELQVYNNSGTQITQDALVVNGFGYVGIGTTTPNAPLDVESISNASGNITGSGYGVWGANDNYSYGSGTGSWGYNLFSIIAAGRILCHGEYDVLSDKRIKNIEDVSNTTSDLETLKKIEVTDFNYKDKVEYGDKSKKGFIAQQVENIYPQAITQRTDYIPDIYARANSANYDAIAHTLTITLNNPHGLIKGDKVRLITPAGKKEVTVENILSDNRFSVAGWDSPVTGWVFVFGKQVNDFRVVDYDRIYTLNVSATQELARRVAALETENEQLKCRNEELDAKTNSIQSAKADAGDIEKLNNQNAGMQRQIDELKQLVESSAIRGEK